MRRMSPSGCAAEVGFLPLPTVSSPVMSGKSTNNFTFPTHFSAKIFSPPFLFPAVSMISSENVAWVGKKSWRDL